jgi:hypothetical protein
MAGVSHARVESLFSLVETLPDPSRLEERLCDAVRATLVSGGVACAGVILARVSGRQRAASSFALEGPEPWILAAGERRKRFSARCRVAFDAASSVVKAACATAIRHLPLAAQLLARIALLEASQPPTAAVNEALLGAFHEEDA